MIETASEAQIKFMQNLGLSIPMNLSKEAAKGMIQAKLDEKTEEVSKPNFFPKKSYSGAPKSTTTMYVSYAKDLYAMLPESISNPLDRMNMACELVKVAQREFKDE